MRIEEVDKILEAIPKTAMYYCYTDTISNVVFDMCVSYLEREDDNDKINPWGSVIRHLNDRTQPVPSDEVLCSKELGDVNHSNKTMVLEISISWNDHLYLESLKRQAMIKKMNKVTDYSFITPDKYFLFEFPFGPLNEPCLIVEKPTMINWEQQTILCHFLMGYKSEAEWIKFKDILGYGDNENGTTNICGWSGKYVILNPDHALIKKNSYVK